MGILMRLGRTVCIGSGSSEPLRLGSGRESIESASLAKAHPIDTPEWAPPLAIGRSESFLSTEAEYYESWESICW